MTTRTALLHQHAPGLGIRVRTIAALLLPVALSTWTGCTSPDDEEVPPVRVEAVEAYGVTLDETSTPQQVTYVLLRSLADDVEAAQRRDRAAQKAASTTTFKLAAYSTIEQRLLNVVNMAKKEKRTSLGEDRDRQLYELVHGWASIVAYYVKSFPTDPQQGVKRMQAAVSGSTAHVQIDVAHDPADASPPKYDIAKLDVELTRESSDGRSYWRVARVGYMGKPIQVQMMPTTQPVAATLPATQAQP